MRRTKIIATVGPASDSPEMLRGLIDAGADVLRLGLAHPALDDALELYHRIRSVSAEMGKPVGILADLPGPKVRIGPVPGEGFHLARGSIIPLRADTSQAPSTPDLITVDYESLSEDVRPGDRLALGDGQIVLTVVEAAGDVLKAEVVHGGTIRGRPGLHIPSDRLRISTPTPEDIRLLDAFVEVGVDMVALSFVRSAHDVRRVGTEPYPRGPLVVAKIETRAAVENLVGIIEACGAIMVARGDLGIECSIEQLPHLQKQIIRDCIALGRPAITATQMLESMVSAPTPTRAEVSDVANAVFDGSSALMLSGETAIGHDPVNVVRTMARIAESADNEFDYAGWLLRLTELRMGAVGSGEERITDAMTAACARAANDMGVAAIICVSESGFTVRSIARFRPRCQILGYSPNERTVNQLTLSWGATPLLTDQVGDDLAMMHHLVVAARDSGYVRSGELVAVLAGAGNRTAATDVLRLTRVP